MAYLGPIDVALKGLLDGKMPQVSIENKLYPVPALISAPEEQFAKAVYPIPSFGIHQYDEIPNYERQYQKEYITSDASAETPYPKTLQKRAAADKVDLFYQITTMSYYAQHDRAMQSFIHKVLPQRGRLIISTAGSFADDQNTSADAPQYALHYYMEGRPQNLDRVNGQYRIFSKAFTFRILGWIDAATKQAVGTAYSGVTLKVGIANATNDAIADMG